MTTRTQHKHSVIIIGGGIAGLTAAVSLARANFAVQLLERSGSL